MRRRRRSGFQSRFHYWAHRNELWRAWRRILSLAGSARTICSLAIHRMVAVKCRQLSSFGQTLSGLANTYWEIIFTHGCEKVAGKSRHKRPGKAGTNFTEPRTSIFPGRAVHSLHYIYPIHTFLDRPLFHSFAGLTPSVAPPAVR